MWEFILNVITSVQFVYAIVVWIAFLLILGGGAYAFVVRIFRWFGRAFHLAKNKSAIEGRVVATGELLNAPFSGRVCVLYDVEIMRMDGAPIYDRKSIDFYIKNDSGHALVRAQDVVAETRFDLVVDDADPKYKAALAKYGLSYEDWRLHKILRCQERVVVPGQMVEIRGSFNCIDLPVSQATAEVLPTRIIEPMSATRLAVHE